MADHQRIKEYIVSCRDIYTRESITENLLKRGHSLEDVKCVWRSLEPVPPSPRESNTDHDSKMSQGEENTDIVWQTIEAFSRSRFMSVIRGIYRILSVIFLLFVIGSLFFCNLFSLDTLHYFFPVPGLMRWVFSFPVFFVTEMAVLTYVGRSLWSGMNYSRAAGILLTVNFVWFVVIIGTCLFGPRFQ